MNCILFDADGDTDLDLLVTSGIRGTKTTPNTISQGYILMTERGIIRCSKMQFHQV